MTCIVGIEHRGTVWLGGDSAATDGAMNRVIIKDPKVFLRGEVGFGVCGSPKVMDALAHGMELPTQEGGEDRAFLVSQLVPAIREGLKKLDAVVEHPARGTFFEGSMLVGYRGKLYQLEGNFQLIHSSDGYDSVGSGSLHALGSLATTSDVRDPKKRLLVALDAATKNAGVAPPFVLVKVKKK